MKINKIREMSSPDLEKELGFTKKANGLDNPMKIREVRKDIARVKTELRQREIKAEN